MLFADAQVIQLPIEAIVTGSLALATAIGGAIWKGINALIGYLERKDTAHAAEREKTAEASRMNLMAIVNNFHDTNAEQRAACKEEKEQLITLLRNQGAK